MHATYMKNRSATRKLDSGSINRGSPLVSLVLREAKVVYIYIEREMGGGPDRPSVIDEARVCTDRPAFDVARFVTF